MTNQTSRRAMSRLDLIMAMVSIAVASAAAFVAFDDGDDEVKGRLNISAAKSIKDSVHLSQIHQALVVFAHDKEGILTRPGLINRVGNTPGRGEEDPSLNTTANLYAALIAQNYMQSELVISPVERNPAVVLKEAYNYDAYAPIDDTYWDATFAADLLKRSNASYAHMPMEGDWGRKHWRDTMNARIVVLANRGPALGERNSDSFTCDPHGFWSGNVVFADNHTEFWRDPVQQNHEDPKDNIFAPGDNIAAFTKEVVAGEAVLQWD